MMREAEIELEFYQFCVSIGLDTVLISNLNDDNLSVLQVVVYNDQAEDLIFPSSISLEDQEKKGKSVFKHSTVVSHGLWYL